jgi:lysozyme family protein
MATTIRFTQELRIEYQLLFNTCIIREDKFQKVEEIISDIERNRGRYLAVGEPLGIPWYLIAVIHSMESSLTFSGHLHNGDPLIKRTVHVPKGRPKTGTPPFTWEESATDALKLQQIHKWSDWTAPGILYKLEEYNGWGYRLHHPHVLSPYLWSASNHYIRGKYTTDGRWSEAAISKQVGAAVILRRMVENESFIFSDPEAAALLGAEPPIQYSTDESSSYTKNLQMFLNTFPGIYVRVDGYPGKKTSDALKKVLGYYLHGDPRSE